MKSILCILLTVFSVAVSYAQPAPQFESYDPAIGQRYDNGYNPPPPPAGAWIPYNPGIGYGSGFGAANGGNQSNGNFGVVSPECPFQEVSPANKDILNRVESALRLLESESRNCPQAENAVRALQASLQNLQRSQSLQVYSNNPGQANCVNYEGRLRREFDVAVSSMQGNSFDFGTVSNYSTCASSGNPSACAQQVYVRQLSQASTICKNTAKADKNQVIRDSLEQMTNTSMALISNSNSCGPKAKEAIIQTVITQATAAASLAQGFGLIGLGINIGGRLLSALASNFLNKNSATSFLEKISAEKN